MPRGLPRSAVFVALVAFLALAASAPGAEITAMEPEMPGFTEPPKPTASEAADPSGWIAKTGKVRRELSHRRFRRWMGDTVLVLVVSEREEYTLLRGRNKIVVQAIDDLVGRRVTVTGPVIPATDRHPRPGLKVMHFVPVPDAMEIVEPVP